MGEMRSVNGDPVGRRPFNCRLFVGRALAVLAGAVFVYAGVLKVRDPLQFANDISNYRIIPWSVGVGLAFYLPWLELLCGLALVFHRFFAGSGGGHQRSHARLFRGDDLGKISGNRRGLRLLWDREH